MTKFSRILYVTNRHTRHALEWIKICKIRDSRNTDHRQIDHTDLAMSVETLRQTVLILYLDLQIRCNTYHRNTSLLFQHLHTGI